MKTTYTFILIISLFCCGLNGFAQDDVEVSVANEQTDTLKFKQRYGLRLGGDMSKLARSFIDDNYTGFEINGDYRLTQRWYLAGELGTEERTLSTDALTITAKGSYFKAGVDYNLYQNWLDMENMIYFGFRIGASTFSQTLDSYQVYNTNNQYWNEQVFVNNDETTDGLTALWGEIILGIKVEVLPNLYMGLNLQLKGRISDTEPSDYENLYIPGFNRTYDSGIVGAGYGYNISYLIPIFKKDKKILQPSEEESPSN